MQMLVRHVGSFHASSFGNGLDGVHFGRLAYRVFGGEDPRTPLILVMKALGPNTNCNIVQLLTASG